MIWEMILQILFSVEPGAVLADLGISAGVAAALASAAGSIGSSLISAFAGPKEPKTIAPPRESNIAKGEADVRRRMLAAKGYKSTILSDLSSQYGGMKTTLGG